MAKIIIPTPLRRFASNQSTIETIGDTVIESIRNLTDLFPDLRQHLIDKEGKLKGFVRIFVEDDDIKALDNEQTKVQKTSIISIIPAIAGGICSL